MNQLLTIEVPNYIRKIKLSDKRRAKYWLKDKVLTGKQKLPKKYLIEVAFNSLENNKILIYDKKKKTTLTYILNKEVCYWKEHKLNKKKIEWRLTDDASDEYIIKNTKVAGTENWYVINSQDIYSGNMHPNTRDKIVRTIHDYIKECIYKQFEGILCDNLPKITTFPIRIKAELFDYVVDDISKGKDWDVVNRMYIWGKCFEDVLQELKIIPDDHRAYVTQPPTPLFTPIESGEPKIVFTIYKDDRACVSILEKYRKIKK